jgi:hypothetical protein
VFQAVNSLKTLGDHAVVGAKDFGNRTLNAIDNIGYEVRSWLSDKFPRLGEPELAGIGRERPTPRPMQSVPERNQPMPMQANHEGPQGAGTQGKGTTQHNESGYDRVYPSATDKPRGMPMDLEEVRARYGEHGVTTVERTERRAQEIIDSGASKKSRGPVLSGVTDPLTGKTYFGQNFTLRERSNVIFSEFNQQLHPLLKERLKIYEQKKDAGVIRVEDPLSLEKAGLPGSHSEIRALDEALKARETYTGKPISEGDLSSFLLHNRSLNDAAGVPPRCVNCWHLTDGVKIIGND